MHCFWEADFQVTFLSSTNWKTKNHSITLCMNPINSYVLHQEIYIAKNGARWNECQGWRWLYNFTVTFILDIHFIWLHFWRYTQVLTDFSLASFYDHLVSTSQSFHNNSDLSVTVQLYSHRKVWIIVITLASATEWSWNEASEKSVSTCVKMFGKAQIEDNASFNA